MIRVKIEPAYDTDWLYADDEWKSFVCPEGFDENVVITGNRDYHDIAEASWWDDAISMIDELDHYYEDDIDDFVDNMSDSGFSEAKIRACARLYENCTDSDDPEFIAEIAEILNPKLDLVVTTIRGSCQGDWAIAVYNTNTVDPNILEDYFFGNLVNVSMYNVDSEDGEEYEEYETGNTITYTEYNRIDDMDAYVRDLLYISPDEEIEIVDW